MYVVPGPAAGGEGETPIPRQAGGIPASPALCVCAGSMREGRRSGSSGGGEGYTGREGRERRDWTETWSSVSTGVTAISARGEEGGMDRHHTMRIRPP